MNFTRRTFLKTSAVTGGLLAASSLVGGSLETLVAAPEGALGAAASETWIPTTCWIGKQDCGMLARVVNGRVVRLEGHPANPKNRGTLCPKGVGQIMSLYDPNRVKAPLVRTNEKGVSGTWREVSWDEALALVADKMAEIQAKDPSLLMWQKGRSKAKAFYDEAFVKASGALKMHHGAFCSDAGYRALEYTIGTHAVLHPDFRDTRYLLSWGWGITSGGGNKTCWLTWPQQLVEAKERGIKVVAIDPRLRSAAHFADEWLPIRPGTDLALALAIINVLIAQDTLDRPYLQKYTNSPFLVDSDGHFLRTEPQGDEELGKPLVWDDFSGAAVPFDTEGIDPVLEGAFSVDGQDAQPAFELLKAHVAQYTPEWAADVTGLPSDKIAQIGDDLAANAMIGATVERDGVTIPYRPVAIMTYHIAQQELGFQAIRAMTMISMLLGAVGAVGGQLSDYTWKIHSGYEKLDNIKIKSETNVYLKDSKFYPINSNNSSLAAKVMVDPEKYGATNVPEMAIVHMANPLGSFPDYDANFEAYKKLKYVVVIDPWLSRTADLFADVVLPAATMEKYEGPMSATDQYVDATAMRIPVMEPMFSSKGDIDIYLDLCEKAGILFGEEGYLAQLNKALKLEGEYTIPTDTKPAVREIFDIWAKAQGIEDGIAYFEKNGVLVEGPVKATKRYGYVTDPPFGGALHRLYGESLQDYQRTMQEMGADKIYWQDYTAFPTWRNLTLEGSPSEYDLYLTSFKQIEFKQSRTPIPLLTELAPHQILEMNTRSAHARGLADGDSAWIESHNAITGETRRQQVQIRHRESIRPDTVGLSHHYGEYANHPTLKNNGLSANSLFFTGEGYVANTADQTYLVKVKVEKA